MIKARLQEDAKILEDLRDTPDKLISVLYRRHKSTFLGYIRRYGGESADHLEVYHDSMLAFYDIWLEGKYDATRASISTLLCAIGRNKLLTRLGKQTREVELTELNSQVDVGIEETSEVEDQLLDSVEQALSRIGDGCREIIVLFYYHRRSIAEITRQLKYKNENVVKAHKSRCMKRLKEIVQSNGS
jgi:RNA polymerase sigma-70 factor (ECF subfamily)